ncbi:hypothetical protein V8E54_004456 [Elaphomyces granulatus]|jgi:hypothetical protein
MEQQRHDRPTRPETLCSSFNRMNISTSAYRADEHHTLDGILHSDEDGNVKDAFPAWEPFFLCPVVPGEDDEENEMLIHPVFNGRFAVPIISNGIYFDSKDKLQRLAINIAHQFFFIRADRHLFASVMEIWLFVLRRLARKSFFSFNDMLGALVLRRSIMQSLLAHFRSAKIQGLDIVFVNGASGNSVVDGFLDTFASCNVALTKQMETSDNEMKARWQEAVQKTGPDPNLFSFMPSSLPCS